MGKKPPLSARVVRWRGFGWGVAFDDGEGKRDAYPVGRPEAAEAEARRLQSGGRPRSPRDVWAFQQVRSIAVRD